MKFNLGPAYAILIITIIAKIITTNIKQDVYRTTCRNNISEKFKVSEWLYAIVFLSTIFLVVLFLGTVFYLPPKGIHPVNIVLMLLGIVCLFAGSVVVFWFSKSYVLIREGTLIYYDGRKKFLNLELNNVKSVEVFQMLITVDVGEKEKKIIPLHFKDSIRLISILKSNINYLPKG